MSAADLKVLTHGLMLLPIKVGLNQDVDLVVTCPLPVEGTLAKSCDVSHMEAHVVLGVSCFLGWCAVKRWIVVWGLGRR